MHYQPCEAITLRIQAKLEAKGYGKTYLEHHTEAKPTGNDDPTKYLTWEDVSSAVYETLSQLADTLNVGDTFEFPNGTTVKVEFKPTIEREAKGIKP